MATKTTTVTFRMTPAIKEMLRISADNERRSIANMIEVMIVDYVKRKRTAGNQVSLGVKKNP